MNIENTNIKQLLQYHAITQTNRKEYIANKSINQFLSASQLYVAVVILN